MDNHVSIGDIAPNIVLTPAEGALLMEQTDALKVSVDELRVGLASAEPAVVMKAWNRMSEHMNYIGSVLQIKGASAARAYFEERQGG